MQTWISIALPIWPYKNLSRVFIRLLALIYQVDLTQSLTTLLSHQPDDPLRELAVSVESLFVIDGVTPHNKVDLVYGLVTNDSAVLAVPTTGGLLDAGVNRDGGTEEGFGGLGEPREGFNLQDEGSGTTRFRC
jgi:hypothetical protein